MLTRAILAVAVLLALLATATTASPVRVRAMQGDAMAPTIGPADAYVVVDAETVEAGDIVVFWAPETESFETRRVVGRTDAGFLTRGDAAQTTDQAAGSSPVPRSGIVGEVATLNGQPVVLPGLGGPVSFTSERSLLLLAAVALLAGVFVVRGRHDHRRHDPDRHIWRVRDVATAVFVGLLITSLALTPLGAASFQVTFMATADGGEARYAVPVGEPVTRTIEVSVAATPFTSLVVEAEGMTVEEWTRTGSTLAVTVTVPPADATGPQAATLSVFPYPGILPRPVLESLHGIHPLVAILGAAAVLLVPPVLAYLLFVDGARPIRAHRVRRRVNQFVRERR